MNLKFKIDGLPSNFATMNLGQKIQYNKIKVDFIKNAKMTCIKNNFKEILNTIKYLKPSQYYVCYGGNKNYYDDSIDFYYN